MNRKEFLSIFGIGSAVLACSYCLGGCKVPDAGITAPTNVDFTLNLADPANASLKSVGGYLYNGGVIVAHAPSGYIAVSSACTHQGNAVQYELASNSFYCPAHGSRFATNGSVINGPAGSALGKYNTTLNGTSLRVFS
ncbi:MAG: Rieske (2Fe-2S) protein [Bacteroidota bacterium]|jgi:cytochrome b6-f complex iron-sulfur subunit